MKIEFTEEQKRVIDTRNKNVLVSAAAGSGKTAVLVERISKLVCDPQNNTDIDELLVMTFTKAAAAEMRERILKRINEELESNPESEHLQKQSALVHRAQINTIDAICQNILRNHFQEISLEPDFRVMEEKEKALMMRDVIDNLMEELYANGGENFAKAVEFFTPKGKNDDNFVSIIFDLFRYSDSFARPEEFLRDRREDHKNIYEKIKDTRIVDGRYEGHPLGVFILKNLTNSFLGIKEEFERIVSMADENNAPEYYVDLLKQPLPKYENVNVSDFESLENFVRDIKMGMPVLPDLRKVPKDKKVDANLNKKIKAELTKIEKLIDGTISVYFTPSLEECARKCEKCGEYIDVLLNVTLEFQKRFTQTKLEKKVVDFGDLEHYALQILVDEEGNPTPVALEYRNHYKEVMVDEYQDSNLIQDLIINAITHEENDKHDKFMVGDVKQSIYGFRQARPDLFLDKLNTYPQLEGCERIDLSNNFRSREEVLNTANDIFDKIMHRETGHIEYDEAAKLRAGASYLNEEGADFTSEFILYDTKISEEIEGEEDLGAYESEAYVLVDTIKRLMREQKITHKIKEGEKEVTKLDKLSYKDIVILHRAPAKIADAVSSVFERENIPVSISIGGGYFSAPEVVNVLQFIRSINNPQMDIPLYGAMTSVFGGYSAVQIAVARGENKKLSLYDAVKNAFPEFTEKLKRYKEMSTYMSVRELIQKIYDDHDYLDYIAALPAGTKRRANAEMLLSYATSFEKTSYYGLHQFVRYIDLTEKYTTDKTPEADVFGESADVVKLMSIHKSKGLEFPVAIIAGMGKQFNLEDLKKDYALNNELGIGCVYYDLDRRTKESTIRESAIKNKVLEETLSEEMRLLYVALTRAKEKLVMVGKCKDAANVVEKYSSVHGTVLSYSKFMKATSFLDFVLPFIGDIRMNTMVVEGKDIEVSKNEEQLELANRLERLDEAGELANSEDLGKIRDRLGYQYPFSYLKGMYTKASVSELKMNAMREENQEAHEKFENREKEIYIPNFREEKNVITGPVRGDSYHRVMEIMDFDRCVGRVCGGFPESYEEFISKADSEKLLASVKDYLAEELKDNRITKICYEAVNPIKIRDFLLSELSYRMWRSNKKGLLRREQPFVLSLSADKVDETFPKEETVIIQGIIDAFFTEGDGIILMDYKTDSIQDEKELITRYTTQIDYYEEAITRLTGKKVTERLLYSFKLGKTVAI